MVTAAVILALLAGCTSVTARPGTPGRSGNGTTGPATGVQTTAQPNDLPASSATPAAESALNCSDFIGTSARAAPLQVVLGVVALPASPGYPALGTSLTGDGNGPLRLFAKTGLLIRPGTTFQLIVPAPFTSRFGIGWGNPGIPSHQVLVSNCADPGADTGGGWLAYVGGYWIDHPACVPVIVRTGGKQQQVHIGVGAACPGQQPPQGLSQS